MIKKGSILVCPHCGDNIVQARKDIHIGEVISAADLKGLQGKKLINGDKTECFVCLYDFYAELVLPINWSVNEITTEDNDEELAERPTVGEVSTDYLQ